MDGYIITGEVKLSFPELFEPKPNQNGDDRYSTYILFDKGGKVEKQLKKLLKDKEEELWPGGKNKPKKLHLPIRDSLVENDEGKVPAEDSPDGWGFGDCSFARVQTTFEPGVIDSHGNDVIPTDIYGGCFARVQVNVFYYEAGKKGLGFGFTNIMKTRDGEKMGSGSVESATDAFADYFEPEEETDSDLLG